MFGISAIRAKLLMIFVCCLTFVAFGSEPPGQMPKVKPVKVYFIHDPAESRWYKKDVIGLTTWVEQQKAEVWTSRRQAERTLSTIYGKRADRCEIKAFILIPAKAE